MKIGEIKVGVPVTYWGVIKGNGDKFDPYETAISSEAWQLVHGDWVCKIEGKSGGMLLSHLELRDVRSPSVIKTIVLGRIESLCSSFLYYDRKEDSELSVEILNDVVSNGIVTVDDMVGEFRKHLEATFKDV